MKKIAYIISIILALTFVACNSPKRHTRQVLYLIKKYSVKKETLDWSKYKKKVLEYGKDATTMEDSYRTIKYALKELHDNHSYFLTPREVKIESDTTKRKIPDIISEYNEGIGYLKIPGFSGNDSRTKSFANRILSHLIEFDQNNIRGWIIDLQNNPGGNMWPMLLGVGPLLTEGVAGYFVDSKKVYQKWGYSEGKVFLDDKTVLQSDSAYHLRNTNKKIAVLINKMTGSSGEAMAIAFIGLPNARLFGEDTYGLTTGNVGLEFKDGSILHITNSLFADRFKREYGKPIKPDVYVLNDDPKETAIKWIYEED